MKFERRKLFLILTASLATVISAGRVWWAQSPSSSQSQSNKSSTSSANANASPQDKNDIRLRIETLLSLSRSVSPEVEADLLLTTVSANVISDKQREIELLDQAFQAAARVKEPLRRRSWNPLVDTRSGFKQRAFELQLDRLSIQSRVILKMVSLDPLRARTMFQDIRPPKIEPLSCKDTLVPDVTIYYQMVISIAQHGFTPEEIKAQSHIQFITDQLETIKSISHATAALKMVASATLSDEELSRVVASLGKAFGQASDDPRAFAFAVQRDGLISVADSFISVLKKRGIPADEFPNKIRGFLIKNMSGEVCGDAGWIKQQRATVPRDLETVNAQFKSPITADDINPSRLGEKAADTEYWATAKGKVLLQMAKELRFAPDGKRFSDEERTSEEWHRKLLAFLEQIDDWDPSSEPSEDDYFQQRCNMYRVLVDLCPDDLQRDAVLRAFGTYLKETNGTYKGRIEWISPVKDYLRILRTKSEKIVQSSLDPWLSSSDNTLRIYAELTMLLGRESR